AEGEVRRERRYRPKCRGEQTCRGPSARPSTGNDYSEVVARAHTLIGDALSRAAHEVNPHPPRAAFFKWLVLVKLRGRTRVERCPVILQHQDYLTGFQLEANVDAVGRRADGVIDQVQDQFLENEANLEGQGPGQTILGAEPLHLVS